MVAFSSLHDIAQGKGQMKTNEHIDGQEPTTTIVAGVPHTYHVWNCQKQGACGLQPVLRFQCESVSSPRI